MYTFITILIIVACIFLTLVVLVQNSKGGGLAANFSASNQIMGVRKTADFLEKATWTMAGSLVVLCMISAFMLSPSSETGDSKSILDTDVENVADPSVPASFPAPAPLTPEPESIPQE